MSDAPLTSRPVVGAAAVCLHGDYVLLVQRAREPNRGRWSYPGGKTEPGETARESARREVFEETGLEVALEGVVDVYDAIIPPYHYCVTDFLARPAVATTDLPPLSPDDDVMDARWVSIHETAEYNLTPAMDQVLRRALWLRGVEPLAPAPLGAEPMRRLGREAVRGLYVVTDDRLPQGRSHVEVARAALAGGARVIQLRDKQRDAGELLPAAREIAALCRAAGALFVVNDRVDLAVACDADGAHLGQTDLPLQEARRLLGPDRLLGISVENVEQVRIAEAQGADYLGVGPIFGTATKADAGDAVGPEQLQRFQSVTTLPLVAIGGISLERVPEAIAAGAHSVAVISAVSAAPDPEAATRALAAACEEARCASPNSVNSA